MTTGGAVFLRHFADHIEADGIKPIYGASDDAVEVGVI
jgi:hypothetical protein